MMTRSTMTAISPTTSLPLSRGGRVTQGSRSRSHSLATARPDANIGAWRSVRACWGSLVLLSLLALGAGCGPGAGQPDLDGTSGG